MVAGAVSFLYSIPCDSFQTLLQQDPTKAILAIKEIIMLTTDMRSNLMSRTVSEGRLNMFKAATTFQKFFWQKQNPGGGGVGGFFLGVFPKKIFWVTRTSLTIVQINLIGQLSIIFVENISPATPPVVLDFLLYRKSYMASDKIRLVTNLWLITFLDLKTNLIYKYMIWMENPY
ncbi:MAG: hypothetical protein IPJ13_09630 [Saprospiraceae bacterium]|nr:hypothetical protein [Saprospiraceae bacterium]